MPVAETSYAVECVCGTLARGVRSAQSQIVECASCRKPVFVFPASPMPVELLGSPAGGTAPELSALKLPAKAAFWLVPASAALVALVIVGFVIASLICSSKTMGWELIVTAAVTEEQVASRLEAVRQANPDGWYHTTRRELDAASALAAIALNLVVDEIFEKSMETGKEGHFDLPIALDVPQ